MTLVGRLPLSDLRAAFGDHLQENVRMSNYTTSQVGGTADAFLNVYSAEELEKAALTLWRLAVPFRVIGSGTNILVSDRGIREVVINNRAKTVKVDAHHTPPTVWAESGANLSSVARQVALRGLAGLEWAAPIPGTVGGAVYGNAGAHGADMSGNLVLAEILHPIYGKQAYSSEQMGYAYRSSLLKRQREGAVILAARLQLSQDTPEQVQQRMEANLAQRRKTQPAGASLGSMFKNPPGDYAGRLIEAAGLKGKRIGGAEISSQHANFFINHAGATAEDIHQLLLLARKMVAEKFGVTLELEIELIGEWDSPFLQERAEG